LKISLLIVLIIILWIKLFVYIHLSQEEVMCSVTVLMYRKTSLIHSWLIQNTVQFKV